MCKRAVRREESRLLWQSWSYGSGRRGRRRRHCVVYEMRYVEDIFDFDSVDLNQPHGELLIGGRHIDGSAM